MANINLCTANGTKNDEFYTRLEGINEEMNYYENKFRNKIILA